MLREILAPCGRFGSTATWDEEMNVRISSLLGKMDAFGDDSYLFARGVPLNWQLLLDRLRESDLTPSESFVHRRIATDQPHRIWIDLAGADLSTKTDGRTANPYGGGRGTSLEESMSKAVGELLERYFLAVYRSADLLQMPYEAAERSGRTLNIRNLNGFLPSQKEKFPRFVRDEKSPLFWTEGFEIISGKKALLPAQLVFWNYAFKGPSVEEAMLMDSNTNGCAGHFSRDEAILSGLLELIQRDGFMIYWLNNLSPAVLDVSTVTDKDSLELIREMRRYNIDFFFLNTTTDLGIPSCVCALIDSSGDEPMIALGASAGFTERELIFQSAGEALVVFGAARERERFEIREPYEPFSDGRIGLEQRMRAWHGKKMLERFKFFVSGRTQTMESFLGEASKYQTATAQLGHVLDILRQKGEGYECYGYEVEDPILTKLNYHVARVIVPKFMHLYLWETNATLDAERLRTVPKLLGYKPAEKLNPWPHPFP